MINTLKVKCIDAKRSKKLIEGAIYPVIAINSYRGEKIIYLRNMGGFPIEYFKTIDGSSLVNYQDFNPKRRESIDFTKKNYTGQLVKCHDGSGKVLKENEIYYIDEQRTIEKVDRNNKKYYETKLKVRGIRNLISPWRFEEIPLIEQRNLKLKNLNKTKIKTGEQTRKFLLYSEKEKIHILFQILVKVLYDIKNIELPEDIDIIKLMAIKGNRDYSLIEEDITLFFKNNIETLLSTYIKTK